MDVGDSSLLTQPLEVATVTNALEPDSSSNRRKSKLKKGNRHSTKSVLEAMSTTETSNSETGASLAGAKVTPLSTIDLTETSPPPVTKITPRSTRVDNENSMPVSTSPPDLLSTSSYKENEVIVVSSKDSNRVECHESSKDDASTKSAIASVNNPTATTPAMSTSAKVNVSSSSAVSDIPTITATPKEPIQKKKKLSFHDKILYTMLTSCKPYTLKSLAQATDTTAEALRHAMLSFLDKQLVLSKEFPSKSSGREPKKLYWANPICLSEADTGDGGKKSSGSAVIKELSKLLASQHEIQEANLMRQQLQQQYRAIQDELNPLLAIPTMKQLDDEMLATEEKLQHVQKEIAAVKDRMAKTPSSILTNTVPKQQQLQHSKPQNPTVLKRKINHMLGEYKTRKRKCMDFVEELSDAMEKKTKDVMGEKILCLDTDEMEWGVWEDGGTGKISGTKSKPTKSSNLLPGRKNDVQESPMTKIPAMYKDV